MIGIEEVLVCVMYFSHDSISFSCLFAGLSSSLLNGRSRACSVTETRLPRVGFSLPPQVREFAEPEAFLPNIPEARGSPYFPVLPMWSCPGTPSARHIEERRQIKRCVLFRCPPLVGEYGHSLVFNDVDNSRQMEYAILDVQAVLEEHPPFSRRVVPYIFLMPLSGCRTITCWKAACRGGTFCLSSE